MLTTFFIVLGACRPQEEGGDLENDSATFTRSDLVGTWRMNQLPAVDPPIVITFSLAANGELSMASDHRTDAEVDPFGRQAYWHYAKLDEERDIIIFRGFKTTKPIDSFLAFEIVYRGDSMIWRPIEGGSEYDWLIIEERVVERIN